VHKGNIQKFTEGGFRKWGYEVAEEEYKEEMLAGRLEVNDIIADNFLQQILLNPEKFDVVALTNLNGDYASDALAAQVGGIGISPGANINYQTGHAIFEATHGTAPDIADQDRANPCSILLSGCMLLEYIGWSEAAELIISAIEKNFKSGIFTADLAFGKRAYSTSGFSNQIISII
jgi:isocitrate dehydrogenase